MKARTEALLGGARARELDLDLPQPSACASCGARPRRPGSRPDFVIYDEDDQVAAVREALRALDLSEKLHPPRRILVADLRAQELADATRTTRTAIRSAAQTFARIAERYRRDPARRRGAVDFDDLLLRTVALLRGERARVRERLPPALPLRAGGRVPGHEPRPVRAHPAPRRAEGGNVTVVGDEDQSIYSWRGADIQNILDFEHDFPGRPRASASRRTTARARPSSTSASAPRRPQPEAQGQDPARGASGGGEPVRLHEAARRVRGGGLGGGADRRRCGAQGRAAVLFRMNAQSRLFEEALLRRRHALLVVVGGVGFYERTRGQGPARLPAPGARTRGTRSRSGACSTCRRGASGPRRWRSSSARAAAARPAPLGGPGRRAWTRRSCPRARTQPLRALPRADRRACAQEAPGPRP